jgi:dinuclear metal center YbgI/SA1388 family protein
MKLSVREIAALFEETAPLSLQESYDNSGLLVGSPEMEIDTALLTIDVTERVIDEAVNSGIHLVISHHPLIFGGLKKITGKSDTERAVIKAIRNNIAVYCAHTNFDSVDIGVNMKICEKLGLINTAILKPGHGLLKKLVTFVPDDHAEHVRTSVFEAGAGHIGNYDMCSYNIEGLGSFRGDEGTNPFVGEKNNLHFEKEIRFETIFPAFRQKKIIEALLKSHPYEEVAYDIYPLDNQFEKIGAGMVGELNEPMNEIDLLETIKRVFRCKVIRHTALLGNQVKKIAVCGGTGTFLLKDAIASGAGIFISSDFKYHQFFEAENKIMIADIGHYESEQFTKELFYELLTKNFPTFAVHLSEVNTNPVYFT